MSRHRRVDGDYDLSAIAHDDELLTQLSAGVDASEGSDELAALFMELREETHAPVPEPNMLLLGSAARRGRAGHRSPWLYGMIGAAAATVVVAAAGAIWLPSSHPSEPTMLELAGTLGELETSANSGDIEQTQRLVSEARTLLEQIKKQAAEDTDPEVATVTQRVPAPAPEPEPQPAVTETVTVTSTPEAVTTTETVTVDPSASTTSPSEPSSQPSTARGEANAVSTQTTRRAGTEPSPSEESENSRS